MKHFFLLLLFPAITATAQTAADSVKKATAKSITNKFPTTRFFDMQYEEFTPSDYDTELNGQDYEKGTIKRQRRFKAAFNIPIAKKQKWVLTGSLRYKFESVDFDNTSYKALAQPGLYHNDKEDFHYYAASVNFTYFSSLFGKTFIYNASVVADGSADHGYETISGLLIGSLILKRTATTTITAGLLVTTNTTTPIPVLPVFSYEHKFTGSKWTIDLIVPRYLYFRRPLLENGRLSLGAMLDGVPLYVYPAQAGYKEVYSYSRSEVKTGFVYEYHLSQQMIATFNAGVANTFGGELREPSKKDEIMKTTQDMNGYFNIGFSYNPF